MSNPELKRTRDEEANIQFRQSPPTTVQERRKKKNQKNHHNGGHE
jgi:hypothetical protein